MFFVGEPNPLGLIRVPTCRETPDSALKFLFCGNSLKGGGIRSQRLRIAGGLFERGGTLKTIGDRRGREPGRTMEIFLVETNTQESGGHP